MWGRPSTHQRRCGPKSHYAEFSCRAVDEANRNPLATEGGFRRQMVMAAHYYTVTWDQLHRDARALAWRLMGSGPFIGIVAISRGGLIPAAIIARELDLRLVESVCVITYQDEQRGEPLVTKPPAAAGDGVGFLIVDDLVDSGHHCPRRARSVAKGPLCLRLCQTRRTPDRGQLRHRGLPGHLDPIPLGYRTPVHRTPGPPRHSVAKAAHSRDRKTRGAGRPRLRR